MEGLGRPGELASARALTTLQLTGAGTVRISPQALPYTRAQGCHSSESRAGPLPRPSYQVPGLCQLSS